jgi:hypothetical protein
LGEEGGQPFGHKHCLGHWVEEQSGERLGVDAERESAVAHQYGYRGCRNIQGHLVIEPNAIDCVANECDSVGL